MKMRILYSFIVLAAVFGQAPAHAASSEWFDTKGAKLRLITAARPETQEIDAALEVLLEKGWKTYWRSPGESGIPPLFDFSASSNILDAEVLFPTPSYFNEFGTQIVGYKHRVIFPIKLKISSLDRPTKLHLKTIIGICGEVCIPVQAKLSVTEPGNIGPTFDVSRALNEAKTSLPSKPDNDLKVNSAHWKSDNPSNLTIEVTVSEDHDQVQLHVEGPQDWFLLPAKLVQREGNLAHFLLDLTDIPDGAKPASTEFRFTLVADGRGIEQVLQPVQ